MKNSFYTIGQIAAICDIFFSRYKSGCSHGILAKRFFELDNLIKDHNISTLDSRLIVYHDFLNDFNPEECDLEICLPISNNLMGKDFIRTIGGGLYATAVYKGKYIGQCSFLVEWIHKNGYKITGPGIEVCINSFMNTRFPKNYLLL